MSSESENEEERNPPWTMSTIGEVIATMNKLMVEHGYTDETPIVWNHLEDYTLTGQVVESHLVYDEWFEITFKDEGSDEGGREVPLRRKPNQIAEVKRLKEGIKAYLNLELETHELKELIEEF